MSSHWSGGVGVDDEEEGELVESGMETSDDDYSPGSLVIDAKDEGTYATSTSTCRSVKTVCLQCMYTMFNIKWYWGRFGIGCGRFLEMYVCISAECVYVHVLLCNVCTLSAYM